MKKIKLIILALLAPFLAMSQKTMTPELLWKLGKVGFVAQSPDGSKAIYKVGKTDIATEKTNNTYYLFDLKNESKETITFLDGYSYIQWDKNGLYALKDDAIYISKNAGATWSLFMDKIPGIMDVRISPNGQWVAYSASVLIEKQKGTDVHPDMPKNSAKIYDNLDYRHWDTYSDGHYNHVFVVNKNTPNKHIDLLEGKPYNTPQKPFGGAEDFIFSPDSKSLVYVCKKKSGKEYATSTNTDIYGYDLLTNRTYNISQGMYGYDVSPAFNESGTHLAWLSMGIDGYESDKNDLVVMDWKSGKINNYTRYFDMTIDGGFYWSNDNKTIYYNATHHATNQLFAVNIEKDKDSRKINWLDTKVTSGQHDITGIYGETKNDVIVSRTDMNHASELFLVNKKSGQMRGISKANDDIYKSIALSDVKMRIVKTTHGKDMGVWVVYPPNFDPNKKYPTLLYCQGGPQGAVSQFYSVRWNFQLMAAQGYIVVAPNRTGLPGYGFEWNEAISGDWGGQPMRDYLSAIDDVAKESYVDKDRLGAVGASYGGYSVFMLAGIHENRFKSFIAHCGLFDMRSWYGTTEELWFANYDLKGNYWQEETPKAYTEFNPSNYVQKWNTPILIFQGEKDYRVPVGQGQQAFQAAQLQGIKSKLVLFPDENHWILKPQNGMVWQREFFNWLKETL